MAQRTLFKREVDGSEEPEVVAVSDLHVLKIDRYYIVREAKCIGL